MLDRLLRRRERTPAPPPAPAPVPDPRSELDAALEEARRRHRAVRNDAARAVAEATVATSSLDEAADEVGEARGLAAEALRRAEAARTAGDAEGAATWERTARGVAGRLVAAEERLAGLRGPADRAVAAANAARSREAEAAGEVAALEARRRELLGDLAGAEAADVVPLDVQDRLERVSDHVDQRVALATARAELDAVEAPERLLAAAGPGVDERADAALAELRRQLGSGGR